MKCPKCRMDVTPFEYKSHSVLCSGLDEKMICGKCIHWEHCHSLIMRLTKESKCDFIPSRFKQKQQLRDKGVDKGK